MKILFCTTAYNNPINGSARFAREVLELSNLFPDVEVDILTERAEDNEDPRVKNVKLRALSRLPVIQYQEKAKAYSREVSRLIRSESYDVVVFNNVWMAAYLELKVRRSIKIVGFIRDAMSLIDREEIAGQRGLLAAMKMRRMLEQKGMIKMDSVWTDSRYMRKQITKAFGITERRIWLVPAAFVDYADISFTANEIKSDEAVQIVYVKADVFRGGLDNLLAAMLQMDDRELELTIIGPAVKTIKKMVKRPKLPKNIKVNVLGPVHDKDEVIAQMQASHIFCLPARYEAFGVANAEAAAAGARIVTTGVDGIPEVLDLSKAWVAKPDDVASLSETLIACMNEPSETTMPKLESQRQHVVRNLGRTKTLRRMHKLLNDVAANKI